jgi:hypothetical protein
MLRSRIPPCRLDSPALWSWKESMERRRASTSEVVERVRSMFMMVRILHLEDLLPFLTTNPAAFTIQHLAASSAIRASRNPVKCTVCGEEIDFKKVVGIIYNTKRASRQRNSRHSRILLQWLYVLQPPATPSHISLASLRNSSLKNVRTQSSLVVVPAQAAVSGYYGVILLEGPIEEGLVHR